MLPATRITRPPLSRRRATYAAYVVHLQRTGRGNTAYAQAARSFLRRWPRAAGVGG